MKMLARIFLIFGILGCFQSAPVRAEEVETGVAPVCDTQKQVERLASLMAYSTKSAVRTVNSEERDPRACGIAKVAYLRGDRIATVRTQEATFEVVKILVLGMVSGERVQTTVPTVYFSVLKIDERAA